MWPHLLPATNRTREVENAKQVHTVSFEENAWITANAIWKQYYLDSLIGFPWTQGMVASQPVPRGMRKACPRK
jgi:hypothetical protein